MRISAHESSTIAKWDRVVASFCGALLCTATGAIGYSLLDSNAARPGHQRCGEATSTAGDDWFSVVNKAARNADHHMGNDAVNNTVHDVSQYYETGTGNRVLDQGVTVKLCFGNAADIPQYDVTGGGLRPTSGVQMGTYPAVAGQ